jgi:hypothetical protein
MHFCKLLAEAVARYRWPLHACVLMDNHYHLIVSNCYGLGKSTVG